MHKGGRHTHKEGENTQTRGEEMHKGGKRRSAQFRDRQTVTYTEVHKEEVFT